MPESPCTCDWPRNKEVCPYCADVIANGIPLPDGTRFWNDLWEPGVVRQHRAAAGKKAWDEFAPQFGKDPECFFCKTGVCVTSCTAMPYPVHICEAHRKHGDRMLQYMLDATFVGG